MENKSKKIFPSQQLVCCLDSRVLKVFMWLCGWQSQGDIKLYVSQMSKFLHLSEEDVELGIQTLEDIKLIDIKKIDQTFIANLNAEQVDKYFKIPMSKIAESGGIQIASEVTWNKEQEQKSCDKLGDMSDQDLKRLLLRIEAQLSEREQVKKVVVKADNELTDLPF